MKLKIACAYCRALNELRIADLEVTKRAAQIGNGIVCVACGSAFSLHISTKRKRKGAKQLAAEAKLAERHKAEVQAQREINAKMGAALLAQPGCTCAPRMENRRTMLDAGLDGGHPLSTGWSRAASGAMLPTLPRHFHGCPCRDSHDEHKTIGATP